MQALILAAGTGSRLKQYTEKVPKCMVPVNGVPMIERAIDSLVIAGIKKLYIGLGYKAEVLKDFIAKTFDEKRLNGMKIDFVEKAFSKFFLIHFSIILSLKISIK